MHRVIAAIEREPVTDGVAHPGEPRLAEVLRQGGAAELHAEMFAGRLNASLVADLVRLLGRQPLESAEVKEQVLRRALASVDIEVRDAAIQAAELWEDRAAIDILRGHVEPVPWLAHYIARVVQQAPA